jgi:methylenetetrahydrofolate reductase (NADPH)
MNIASLLGRGKPVFSFEFFPPKTEAGDRALVRTLAELRPLAPDFVSAP